MKQIQFITLLMGMTGSSLFIPKLFSFLTSRKTLTLYEGWFPGMSNYNGPDIDESLRTRQPLEFCREPQNEHNDKAIEIYADNYKLGYISRVDNSILARLMDQVAAIEAEISEVSHCIPQWEKVKVRIQTLPGLKGRRSDEFKILTVFSFETIKMKTFCMVFGLGALMNWSHL